MMKCFMQPPKQETQNFGVNNKWVHEKTHEKDIT